MKKAFLAILMSLSICSLIACGNSKEKAVKESYKESGLDDEEINELLEELDDDDINELLEELDD